MYKDVLRLYLSLSFSLSLSLSLIATCINFAHMVRAHMVRVADHKSRSAEFVGLFPPFFDLCRQLRVALQLLRLILGAELWGGYD